MYEIHVHNKGRFYVASRVVALSCCQETWPGCKLLLLDSNMHHFEVLSANREIVADVNILPVIENVKKLFETY